MSFTFRSSTTKLLRRPSLRRHASTTTPIESDFTHRFKTTAYTVAFSAGATAFVVYYADSRSAIHRYVVPPLSRTLLDAETAHKVALGVLSRGLGPKDTVEDDQVLKVEVS
jgi:dihydroorotate dehydrogenase